MRLKKFIEIMAVNFNFSFISRPHKRAYLSSTIRLIVVDLLLPEFEACGVDVSPLIELRQLALQEREEQRPIPRMAVRSGQRFYDNPNLTAELYRGFGFPDADLHMVAERLLGGHFTKIEKLDPLPSWAALALLLFRLRTGAPYFLMRTIFGFSEAVLSRIIRFVASDVVRRWKHVITWPSELIAANRAQFSAIMEEFYADPDAPPLAGWLDGTIRPSCRPVRDQHMVYSGWKRLHGLKCQSIVFPNGLWIIHGPFTARSHDAAVLRRSPAQQLMRQDLPGLRLHADKGYYATDVIWAPRNSSKAIAEKRVLVEWMHAAVLVQFPMLGYKNKLKLLHTNPGTLYRVAAILVNARTALYGNEVTRSLGTVPFSFDDLFQQ